MLRIGVFLLCFFFMDAAFACPMLEFASPKVGSEITQTPKKVTIHFSSPVTIPTSTFTVEDKDGNIVSHGPLIAEDTKHKVISVLVSPLKPGDYTVSWNMYCKACESYTPGDYSFTVIPPQ